MKPIGTTAILWALCLAGCTVGPDFVPPAWNDPAISKASPSAGGIFTERADPQPDWWTRFDDPELASLIERATRGNFDQKIAVQRIGAARSTEVSEASAGLPSLKAKGSYSDQQSGLDALKGQIGGLLPIKLTQAPPPQRAEA